MGTHSQDNWAKQKLPKKKPTVGKLKKRADTLFSKYIRLEDVDWAGYCECYTCGTIRQWNNSMQCGHFHSRRHSSTRYDKENARVQCQKCNMWDGGKIAIFARKLLEEKGKDFIDTLEKKALTNHSFTIPELQELIKDLNKKIRELESM